MMKFDAKYLLGPFVMVALCGSAHADGPPKHIPAGEHLCKASKEYKLRKCRVVDEGDTQVLSVYEPGHLLLMEGVIYPNDHMGKKKVVFVEARLTGENPYICNNVGPEAAAECKSQKVMIKLQKKGNAWVGTFALKHYWNKYQGQGAERHVVGHQITVEELSFTLKPGKAKK